MDGPHDLGGKQGFGPVDVDAPPFRHDWEWRQWALTKNVETPGGTLDWWRATMEQTPPVAYLGQPYFVKWCMNDLVQAIDKGIFTLAEVLAGKTDRPLASPATPRNLDAALARVRANLAHFNRQIDTAPAFAVGDKVLTNRHGHDGHTRLPAYARATTGTITAHHGAHVFADRNAEGVEEPQHLYTVEFAAPALWGKDADPRDTVRLDLWEPYLASSP